MITQSSIEIEMDEQSELFYKFPLVDNQIIHYHGVAGIQLDGSINEVDLQVQTYITSSITVNGIEMMDSCTFKTGKFYYKNSAYICEEWP